MDRLARLLPFRAFGRLRTQRAVRPCTYAALPETGAAVTERRGATPVRIYRTQSRVVLVGTIDAVCAMIDRCIAEERAGSQQGLFDRAA
jgi:hypothetical protein